jgi:hypothetical protein
MLSFWDAIILIISFFCHFGMLSLFVIISSLSYFLLFLLIIYFFWKCDNHFLLLPFSQLSRQRRFRHVNLVCVCVVLLALVGRGGKGDRNWNRGGILKWVVESGKGLARMGIWFNEQYGCEHLLNKLFSTT